MVLHVRCLYRRARVVPAEEVGRSAVHVSAVAPRSGTPNMRPRDGAASTSISRTQTTEGVR